MNKKRLDKWSRELLMKSINKANLHQEEITDKNGNRKKVWKKNGDDETGLKTKNPSREKTNLAKQKTETKGGVKSKGDKIEELLKKYPKLAKEEVIKRLELGVPMVAEDVQWIEDGKVVCKFKDSKGRSQAIYTKEHVEKASKKKYEKIVGLAGNISRCVKDVDKQLKSGIVDKEYMLALAVKLLQVGYFRIGNEDNVKKYNTYGLSTLRREHMTVEPTSITFDYIGKKSVHQTKVIKDKLVISAMNKVVSQSGYNDSGTVLSYDDNGTMKSISANDVREYLKEYGMTPKDFRTIGANKLLIDKLTAKGEITDAKKRHKELVATIKEVAKELGHTPSICRESYLFRENIDKYLETGRF